MWRIAFGDAVAFGEGLQGCLAIYRNLRGGVCGITNLSAASAIMPVHNIGTLTLAHSKHPDLA